MKPAKEGAHLHPEEGKMKAFFTDELKDSYLAEKKLVNTLPKLATGATSGQLRDAIAHHLEETKEHVTRPDCVLGILDEKAEAKKCDTMEGITEEGAGIIEDTEDGTATRDVALIPGLKELAETAVNNDAQFITKPFSPNILYKVVCDLFPAWRGPV